LNQEILELTLPNKWKINPRIGPGRKKLKEESLKGKVSPKIINYA